MESQRTRRSSGESCARSTHSAFAGASIESQRLVYGHSSGRAGKWICFVGKCWISPVGKYITVVIASPAYAGQRDIQNQRHLFHREQSKSSSLELFTPTRTCPWSYAASPTLGSNHRPPTTRTLRVPRLIYLATRSNSRLNRLGFWFWRRTRWPRSIWKHPSGNVLERRGHLVARNRGSR